MYNQNKTSFFKKPRTKEMLFVLALVIIPLLNFAIFWVYVNFETVIKTFFRYVGGNYEFIGISRYVRYFKEYVFGVNEMGVQTAETLANFKTFWNSFRAIIINVIIFPIALTASYAFYKKIFMEKYFRICFYLPSLISISVLAIMYRSLFDANFGPISLLLDSMGIHKEFFTNDSPYTWGLIYFFSIFIGLGSNVIMMSGAMLRIPSDIGEYSQLEGVGFWRELFQIVLPLVMPTVGVYIVNIFISVFGFTMHPMMITGDNFGIGHMYDTVGWFILRAAQAPTKTGTIDASTLGLVLTLVMLPWIIAVRWMVKKFTPDVQF